MKIYLAGSLFNEAERDYEDKITKELESMGNNVYWPWRDAGDEELKRKYKEDTKKINDEIVKRDIDAIKNTDMFIALIEGADVESGTSMEIGYAHALNKRIVGLRTDFRTQGESIGPANIMITRPLEKLFNERKCLYDYLKNFEEYTVNKKNLPYFYSSVSEEYDNPELHPITNSLRSLEQSFTKGFLIGKEYETTLDIGCGTGGFLEFVNAKTKIGIDISEGMIRKHSKFTDGNFIISDIEQGIPLETASVDLVHSGFLIDHIEENNFGTFFHEINRVLKKKEDTLLLSFYSPEKIRKYRKSDNYFEFKAANGNFYQVESIFPEYDFLKERFDDYFSLMHKEDIDLKIQDLGITYMVLGAKK